MPNESGAVIMEFPSIEEMPVMPATEPYDWERTLVQLDFDGGHHNDHIPIEEE